MKSAFVGNLNFSNHVVIPFRPFTNSSFSLQTFRLLQQRR